jgi:hypothetical protein
MASALLGALEVHTLAMSSFMASHVLAAVTPPRAAAGAAAGAGDAAGDSKPRLTFFLASDDCEAEFEMMAAKCDIVVTNDTDALVLLVVLAVRACAVVCVCRRVPVCVFVHCVCACDARMCGCVHVPCARACLCALRACTACACMRCGASP